MISEVDLLNKEPKLDNQSELDIMLNWLYYYQHEDFLKDLSQRRLVFNPNTDYPLVSDIRIDKYQERGFTISKKEKFKVLLAVNGKNINSWEVLKDELGSMYGLNKDDLFEEDKEFSISEAMEQLENIKWTDSIYELNHPSYKQVERVILEKSGIILDDMKGRYFKVVAKSDLPNVYHSIYANKYIYVLGQDAIENKHGIYFAEGFDGLEGSCYWKPDKIKDKSYVIIELEFQSDIKDSVKYYHETSMCSKEAYKVVREISFEQWMMMRYGKVIENLNINKLEHADATEHAENTMIKLFWPIT